MTHNNPKSGRVRATLLVPCYNEQEVLPLLLQQVAQHFNTTFGDDWELVLVDDGSTDATAVMIRDACERDSRIRGVLLSRNFGHQPAIAAGLPYCTGRSVGIVDCDLQDPIEVLMQLYRAVEEEGQDVAYGVRQRREGPLLLRAAYKTFYRMIGSMAEHPWPVDAGDFCVMNRRCVDQINRLPERVRMLRGMRSWIGYRQIGVPYARPKRAAGASHYNFARLCRLATDAVVGFSSLPLRLASFIGIFAGVVSGVLGLVFLLNRLVPQMFPWGYDLGISPGIATLAVLVALLGSAILICLGILGEYMALLLKEVKGRPSAIVAETVGMSSTFDSLRAIP